jgi:hypothetical protein
MQPPTLSTISLISSSVRLTGISTSARSAVPAGLVIARELVFGVR